MKALTAIAAELSFETPLKPNTAIGARGELMWIAPDQLYIDESYQRRIEANGKKNVRGIVEQFRWSRFSPLKVSVRAPGQFAVLDGQHKGVAAILHAGIELVPCLAHTLTPDEEADAFATINGNLTRLQPLYLFRARVSGGEAKATAAAKAAADAGVRIMPYAIGSHQLKAGETLASGTIEACLARFGREALVAGLLCITKTGDGNAGLVKADLIEAFAQAFYFQPKWLAAAKKARVAVDERSVKKLLNQATRNAASTGGGVRKALIALIDKLFADALGDGGPRPQYNLVENARFAQMKQAPLPLHRANAQRAEAARREQAVIRAAKVRAVPKVDGKAHVSAEERAMIEAHLKAKGARKVESGATGNPTLLCEYLQRRGYKIETAPKFMFRYRGKLIDGRKVVELANIERAKDGLAPLTVAA